MKTILRSILLLCALFSVCVLKAEILELDACKDNFGRSNERNQNSGGSSALYLAHSSMLRAIVAFDLSTVTNEITSVELRLTPANNNEEPLDMIISPMVETANNAAWKEGTGAVGAQGRNAMVGESTFSRSEFPDQPWETASGGSASGLSDSGLWRNPVASMNNQPWKHGEAMVISLDAVALLESVRNSKSPLVTFGFWGVGGDGYYAIASRESGNGPRLILTVAE